MIGFYATQLHLLARWTGGSWGVVRRGVATLTISMLALLVTAWLLPSVGLRDVPSALAAALVLAAMRTFLRPVLIAYVSQISVAVATIATVLVQALAFWLMTGAGWMVLDRPVDAVVAHALQQWQRARPLQLDLAERGHIDHRHPLPEGQMLLAHQPEPRRLRPAVHTLVGASPEVRSFAQLAAGNQNNNTQVTGVGSDYLDGHSNFVVQ